jgi:serine/threonine-protein kinase
VREYDDGTYTARLTADTRLSLATHPADAEVLAFRYVERDRVLRAESPRTLGTTPLREAKLEPGRWLLVLRREGYRDVRYPVLARRGEHLRASVNLYTEEELGEGMIYVPGGPCIVGGDPEAFDSLSRQVLDVADFAIGRFPVTFDAYLAFIHDVEPRDPAWANKRLPRASESGEGTVVERDDAGRWVPRWDILVEGEQARKFCPREAAGQVPVFCIDWFDAMAYCHWQGAREGRLVRLATEVEREKATRGVDGRWFPWGDHFDPTFCKMRESRPGFGQPEPIGAFTVDESPYGVRDLAGNCRDWVADVIGELSAAAALAESEPAPEAPRDQGTMRIARGGAWNSMSSWCRSAARNRSFALSRRAGSGLRLARPLVPRG